MQNYIVSARKYRPMSFDSVVGQSALTTTLKNAVKSGKLAHAYLFCGPRGVGKTTCARIFAKAINCEHPHDDGEACNECESCAAFNEGRSYNIFELDAASNNSVENIKTLMEQTRIPPQVGKYKVFIIDEVHMLSAAAFNAFLKTLEEPPSHVIFILATTEKNKILPTILSRCQIYDFERMTVANTVAHLQHVAQKEGISYEDAALEIIAEKADGGMRDALSIFDQAASFCQGDITYAKVIEDLNVLDADNYFRLVDLALVNKVSDMMLLLNNVIEKGFDGANLINGLSAHIRNVMMAKDEATLPLLECSEKQKAKYKEQAQKAPTTFLYTALRLLNQCDINYRQSSNKRLLVELTLIQVAQLTQPDDKEVPVGRQPHRLKSLFKNLMATRPQPASQVAGAGKNTLRSHHRATPTSEHQPVPALQSTTTAATLPQDKPTAAGLNGKIQLGSVGFTFQNLLREPKKKTYEKLANDEDSFGTTTPPTASEQEEFTNEQLELAWMSMCNRMQGPLASLADRIRNIKPHITEFPAIEVIVDNELLLEQVKKIQNRIKATMRASVHHSGLSMTLRVARPEEVSKILTKREVFEELLKKNPAMKKLTDSFSLVMS